MAPGSYFNLLSYGSCPDGMGWKSFFVCRNLAALLFGLYRSGRVEKNSENVWLQHFSGGNVRCFESIAESPRGDAVVYDGRLADYKRISALWISYGWHFTGVSCFIFLFKPLYDSRKNHDLVWQTIFLICPAFFHDTPVSAKGRKRFS